MVWMTQLLRTPSVAQVVVLISLVAAAGLALGSVRYKGVGLGIAGVLFSGLLAGHLLGRHAVVLDEHVMEFVREFGLVLFVYAIGMQVGPGFLASLRREGLPLNLMALGVVVLGVGTTLLIVRLGLVEAPVAVGLFAGATTNTPSLAAAQQALKDLPGLPPGTIALPGMAYAVAYPFGIVGIILAMLAVRGLFRINLRGEVAEFQARQAQDRPPLETINLEVRNPDLDGVELRRVPALEGSGVVVSRILHAGVPQAARPETVLHSGDVLHAVGPPARLEQLRQAVGAEANVDLKALPGNVASRRIIVTRSGARRRTLADLRLRERFGVNVTRVNRAGIDLAPAPALRLQFADSLLAVGERESLEKVVAELGDSQKDLNHPQIIPIFVGIALGVLLGSWPFPVPGLPADVRLGLAGGPLLVAIVLSRLGNVGPLVWYLPLSANLILREIGIVLFLAAVGLRAGDGFVETVLDGSGLSWMGYGAAITLLPLLAVALLARAFYKLNYLTLCGLLAGSMTDPPALAFAGAVTGSDVPSVSYATVYPLVMIARVLAAQAMVLLMMS